MNKLYSLAAAMLAATAFSASAEEPIFTEDFATQTKFDKWTFFDANDDSKTWIYDETGDPYKVYYSYHEINDADDWLFSPVITIPSDGYYLVTFDSRGSSYTESLEVWTGRAANVASMTEKVLAQDLAYQDYTKSILLTAKAGDLVLGFHAVTPSNRYRLYLGNVQVKQIAEPKDIALIEASSPRSGEGLGQEDVKVKVKNEGPIAISEFTIEYTYTYGDNTKTVSERVTPTAPLVPGATMEYTFAEKADLSTPRTAYNFTVRVILDSDINADNDKLTFEVRHLAPATVPYYMGFESTDDTSNLSFIDGNNDDSKWHVEPDGWFTKFSRTGSASLCYSYSKVNAADDWAFLDPFSLKAGHYALKFWYSATDHPEKLRVCWGTAPTPEAMTNVIVEYNPLTNSKYAESVQVFEVPSDGRYYIGFYAFSDADQNWLCIDDVSLELIPENAADIEIMSIDRPFDYWRAPQSLDGSITVRTTSVINPTADVVVSIDGNEVKRISHNFTAMKVETIEIPGILNGVATGEHTLRIDIDYADDSNKDNNVIEHILVILPEHIALWDFEDLDTQGTALDPVYILPTDLTYRSEDTNTIHPDAGDEFDSEHGFGIFNIQHPLLGEHALAACTWFTDKSTADRWVVLPPMEIKDANAWFAWDAMSFNPNFLESYRVKVSDGRDYWADYNTEASIDDESVYHKTRGISLAKYAGKTVHIAINVKTYEGEALVLDNLGVYGSVAKSGIDDIILGGDSDANAPVHFYNLQGVEVSAENIPAGIYIRRQGNISTKILVK